MARRIPMRIVLPVVIALILGPLPGCGESPPSAPATKHVVVYQGAGWRGILVVNQLPVQVALGDPQGQQRGIAITEWVQSGPNEVAIVAECDPGTTTALAFQIGTFTGDDVSTLKLVGEPVGIPVPAEGEASVGTTSFQAPPADKWIWQQAQMIQNPSDQDIQEIQGVLQRFYTALKDRRVDDVLGLMETRTIIKARAMGMTPDEARKHERDKFERLFALNAQVALLDPQLITIRQFGRGVMIFPSVLNGTMNLVVIENKLNPEASYICPFLSLCKIDGKWVVIN